MWQSNMITVLDESPLINIDSYGIDYNGLPFQIITDNNIIVPSSEVELTDEQLQVLQNHVHPLTDDGDNGIKQFLRAVNIVDNFVNQ